jgi:hypothetical protein
MAAVPQGSTRDALPAPFLNGQTIDLAQVTLASFSGEGFLQSVTGGAYAQTDASGVPIFNARGTITPSSLEGSNTDIADQFTKQIYQQLQQALGAPSASASPQATYANFTGAVQSLAANPSDYSAQVGVINAAKGLAAQLNSLTSSVQQLRSSLVVVTASLKPCSALVLNCHSIAISAGDNAAAILADINGATGTTGVTASLDPTNHLVVQSDAATAVDIGAGSSGSVLSELGLSVGTTNPTNLVTQGAVTGAGADRRGEPAADHHVRDPSWADIHSCRTEDGARRPCRRRRDRRYGNRQYLGHCGERHRPDHGRRHRDACQFRYCRGYDIAHLLQHRCHASAAARQRSALCDRNVACGRHGGEHRDVVHRRSRQHAAAQHRHRPDRFFAQHFVRHARQ